MGQIQGRGFGLTASPFAPESTAAVVHKTMTDAVAALDKAGAKGAILLDATSDKKVKAILISNLVNKDNFHWSILAEGTFDPAEGKHVAGHIATALTWR